MNETWAVSSGWLAGHAFPVHAAVESEYSLTCIPSAQFVTRAVFKEEALKKEIMISENRGKRPSFGKERTLFLSGFQSSAVINDGFC